MTLPGCSESLKNAGPNANAGVARASAGISSSAHLLINFLVPSFSLRPAMGGHYRYASGMPCRDRANLMRFQSFRLEPGPEGKTRTGIASDFPDWADGA